MEIPHPLFSLISPIGREGISRDLNVHPSLGFPFQFYIWFRHNKYIFGYHIWVFGLEPHARNSWNVWNCFQKILYFQKQFTFTEPMYWDGWKAGTGTNLPTTLLCLIIFQQWKHCVVVVEGQHWGSLQEALASSHLSVPWSGAFPPSDGCMQESYPQGYRWSMQ